MNHIENVIIHDVYMKTDDLLFFMFKDHTDKIYISAFAAYDSNTHTHFHLTANISETTYQSMMNGNIDIRSAFLTNNSIFMISEIFTKHQKIIEIENSMLEKYLPDSNQYLKIICKDQQIFDIIEK